MRSLLFSFLLCVATVTLSAQSIFPDLRNPEAQDRMAKLFSKEFKTPEKVTGQIMDLCKSTASKQASAYAQFPKNQNDLNVRLGQIESYFYGRIEQFIGKEKYDRFRKEQPELLKKYNL